MHSTTELYRPPPLISFWWVLIKTILVIDNRNHFRLSKAEKRIYIIDTEYPRAESLVKFEERLNFGVGQLAGTEAGCSLSHAEDTQSCMCSFFSLHICLFFCFSLFLFLFADQFSLLLLTCVRKWLAQAVSPCSADKLISISALNPWDREPVWHSLDQVDGCRYNQLLVGKAYCQNISLC